MTKISCDNCEKIFEAPAEKAGSKMPCPHCGDINRVPAEEAPAPAPASSGAAAAESGREEELCVVRPAMFRAHPFRYLLIIMLLLCGPALAVWSWTSETFPAWIVTWLGIPVSAGGAIWFVGWWVSSHFWRKLVVSNKRTVRHEGIVTRHTTEVLHDHVRSVDIRQSFLQRVLSVGAIGIDSAGQDGVEIEMHDIPRPYDVKKVIDRFRKM
jgi:membrane protein YdbS with pleckstrin-like domain/phage FluMu protein Com